jgi:putative restriction endonuclease
VCRWGAPLGVEVNTLFPDRAALIVVGIHKETMKGIASGVCGGHRFGQSIVLSGGYENDVDDGCTFEYTGEGGNDFLGSKLQTEDQRLKGGNLALANCKMHAVPVRVVRRLKSNELRYDGLYKVVAYAEELVRRRLPSYYPGSLLTFTH